VELTGKEKEAKVALYVESIIPGAKGARTARRLGEVRGHVRGRQARQ